MRLTFQELKLEATQVPAREARRIKKMLTNYTKQKGLPAQRGGVKKVEEPIKGPKIQTHANWKLREKNKFLDGEWGPLGW